MQIKIKVTNYAKFAETGDIKFDVESTDTVESVKLKLAEAHGIAAEHQAVIFNGKKLADTATLQELSIEHDATLWVCNMQKPTMQIIVKTLKGQEFRLNVAPSDNLAKVKSLIEQEQGVPPENQVLVYKGKQWPDNGILQEMGVLDEHTIHMVPRPPKQPAQKMVVKVKMLSGKVMDVEVNQSETVGGLMYKIAVQEGYGVEQQRLIFAGAKLEDKGATLSSKKIEENSTVHLVLKPLGGYNSAATASSNVPHTGKPIQLGAVGLQNLGNTCFMNSSIQCLSNIPPLKDFFLEGEYKKCLNREAYKTGGKLAEAFAELLSVMWHEDTAHVSPVRFKWQVGQFAEHFSGYGQQDSMELFEYVLDGLKEDCNKAQKRRKYVEVADAAGRDDEEVAREALAAYQQRSDSKVDDLFLGLFKSTVRCPGAPDGCGKASVTFDPFLSVKLPLLTQAEEREARFSIIVVRSRRSSPSDHSVVHEVQARVSKDGVVSDLLKAVEVCMTPAVCGQLVLVDLFAQKVLTVYAATDSVEQIRPGALLVAYEVEESDAYRRQTGVKTTVVEAVASDSASVDNTVTGSSAGGSASSTSAANASVARPFGAVVYQRRPSTNSNLSASSQQLSCELCGVPIFVPLPSSGCSARELHAEVAAHLRCGDRSEAANPSESAAMVGEWKLFQVQWTSPTHGGQLVDPNSDEDRVLPPEPEQQVLTFTVEWEAGTSLPAWTMEASKLIAAPRLSAPCVEQELNMVLQRFVAGEQLGSDDAWLCTSCNERKQAWKKLEFHTTPPVLVFQLKRFQYTRYTRERLNIPVSFPLEGLDMSQFSTASSQNSKSECPETMLYDLAGVSTHFGGLGGGHYIAHARSSVDGEWYCFDDKDVRRITAEDVSSNKVGAYILFYIRRDYAPQSFRPPPPAVPAS
mmetsp:Transcript_38076/g.89152  ORF Transcript_38076/g.89152 Transcript_38076/m.89152 type:complete len:913 (+) Transcript_38076:49-2787(+)